MKFNEKLQELRKQQGLTQEMLAEALFVSRTAVSKWESGRGYSNIDSLKAIAAFFGVTVDDLLSGNEVLTIAEEDAKLKKDHFHDLLFGLLDLCFAAFLFLPLFRQKADGGIRAVSLLSLVEVSPWLRTAYVAVVVTLTAWGVLTLALQSCRHPFWLRGKRTLSLLLNAVGATLFIISLQPYAAVLALIFLAIKAVMLLRRA